MTHGAKTSDGPSAEAIASIQKEKLVRLLGEILLSNSFYQTKLRGASAETPLAQLPLTTRAELEADQASCPPYGTNLTFTLREYSRFHQTSGSSGQPLRVLDRAKDWTWWKRCWGEIFRAARVGAADHVLFPFSFGPFVGFWAAFESAAELGCLCLPAGGMTTTARLEMLRHHSATVVCCTPTYALRLLEAARAQKQPLENSSVRALIVAGEPGGSLPATRKTIEDGFGARVFDHAGMSEVGPYAFECVEAPGGMHILESEFIAEVIDPRSAKPVADGAVGELVLTNLGRAGWPLIRYRTGDLVQLRCGRCACGRDFVRIEGGLRGRADEMFFIRGNNVYPAAVEDLVRGVAGVAEFELLVDDCGPLAELTIRVEPSPGACGDEVARQVAAAIQDRLLFRPGVQSVAPGTLPRYEMKARRFIKKTQL